MEIVATIPDQLVPKIVEVFKATYPEITDGLGPSASIKAVITYWTRTTLATFAVEKARAEGEAMVDAASKAKDKAIKEAKEAVMRETEVLVIDIPELPDEEPPAEETPAEPKTDKKEV